MIVFNDLLEEFEEARRNAYISAITLKGQGKIVAGIFGKNIPREILWALEITPVNVYSIDGSNICESEGFIDSGRCSLVKASYGYTVTERCPLIYSSDIIISNNACPHKTSMISKLSGFKESYIIEDYKEVEKQAAEYKKFAEYLENKFNKRLNKQALHSVIQKTNKINTMTKKIMEMYMSGEYPISVYDLHSIIYGSQFFLDLDERYAKLSQMSDALENLRIEKTPMEKNNIKKVFITGAPLAGLTQEILKPLSIMKNIFVVLSQSLCEGENYQPINEGENPYLNLAEKYIRDDDEMNEFLRGNDTGAIIDVKLSGCDVLQITEMNTLLPSLSLTVDYDYDIEKINKALHFFIHN